ncbi:MAG: PEP-utilizing enzyme [Patescibacteria group bacterium UBA2103]
MNTSKTSIEYISNKLMLAWKDKNTTLEWRRINMRTVEHLIGAEFIHDLYNQHAFKINSFRFRNTVTVWKNGIVNSYAPQAEWDEIGEKISEKFLREDKELIFELENLYSLKRKFADTYIKKFFKKDLHNLSNVELATAFEKLYYFTLGDFYRLNFVQVEHGLTVAIKKKLKEVGQNPDNISKLIVSKKPTEFQKEEILLRNIAKIRNQNKRQALLTRHYEKYAFMHSAYGERPYPFSYYEEKTKQQNFAKDDIEEQIKKEAKKALVLLRSIKCSQLERLVYLMIRGGEFRDSNKARLGFSMSLRFKFLEEIAKRTGVERDDLNFYSLNDLGRLLRDGLSVSKSLLSKRKEEGVVLARVEDIDVLSKEGLSERFFEIQEDSFSEERCEALRGMCASPGSVEGTARIVFSYEDGEKVEPGDIMVAIGTDFDLMDAIQKSAAVITEEGGLLSHASVVCRELKKPCCIGVEHATSIIKDGQKICLDAEKGEILLKDE